MKLIFGLKIVTDMLLFGLEITLLIGVIWRPLYLCACPCKFRVSPIVELMSVAFLVIRMVIYLSDGTKLVLGNHFSDLMPILIQNDVNLGCILKRKWP